MLGLSPSLSGDLARLISKQGGFFGGLDTTKEFRQTGKIARQLPWITGPTALDNALEALLTGKMQFLHGKCPQKEGEPPLSFDS